MIGLGTMGLGMAMSLRRADYALHACDVRQEVAEEFFAANGVACSSQADMAVRCEVVVSAVVKAVQTETVRFGGTAQQMFMQASTAGFGRVMTVL